MFDSAGNRIAEYNEATGDLIREYVWMGRAPLAVIEGGVTTFIRTNHRGRRVFSNNTRGTNVCAASYLLCGSVRTTTGTPITSRFPAQWFQYESGLHQNWMRDYDPTTGRYLQADPLGLIDGPSVYGYVKQNPGRWSDPAGLCIDLCVGEGIIAGWVIAAILRTVFVGEIVVIAKPAYVTDPQAYAEWKEYKNRYAKPIPPNLDPCEELRQKLAKEKRLLSDREAWDAKWGAGHIDNAIPQNKRAIENSNRN